MKPYSCHCVTAGHIKLLKPKMVTICSYIPLVLFPACELNQHQMLLYTLIECLSVLLLFKSLYTWNMENFWPQLSVKS